MAVDWERALRLAKEHLVLDERGQIKPSKEAFLVVERENADKPTAERYRLAQARTLMDAYEKASGRKLRDE